VVAVSARSKPRTVVPAALLARYMVGVARSRQRLALPPQLLHIGTRTTFVQSRNGSSGDLVRSETRGGKETL